MDVKHFSYFVKIVENGCNLSLAAKAIHISQSALSKIILTIEQEESVQLFVRSHGRLTRLTSAGELYYSASRDISARYGQLLSQLQQESKKFKGEIRVGIPPLVLSVVFSSVITVFKKEYPNIDIVITEAGAEDLKKQLMNGEIEYAVLLAPSGLNPQDIHVYTLFQDVLAAFVSRDNQLAQRGALEWADIDNREIAIFNESFSINRLLHQKFKEVGISPVIGLKSASWDFLLEIAQNSNLITILPGPIVSYADARKIRVLPFSDPIVWEVILVESSGKTRYASQNIFKNFVVQHFKSYPIPHTAKPSES